MADETEKLKQRIKELEIMAADDARRFAQNNTELVELRAFKANILRACELAENERLSYGVA